MTLKFLSLEKSDLSNDTIIKELIPLVSTYLLEFYSIKKQIIDTKDVPPEVLEKFKLLVDIIKIYKDPNLLKFIKNSYTENNDKDLDLEIDNKNSDDENEIQNILFGDMLDTAYEEIDKYSTLKQNLNVTRKYMCGLEENE